MQLVSGLLTLKDPVMMPHGYGAQVIYHDDWVTHTDGSMVVRNGQDLIAIFPVRNCVGFVNVDPIQFREIEEDLTERGVAIYAF